MEYVLTENIKKSINEFEELLKTFSHKQQDRAEDIQEVKQKIENAISLITEMEE